MSTLSVPLTPALEKMIDKLIQNGIGENKAEIARKAIEYFAEEQAVQAVLRAESEPSLRGNLDDLAKKL